MPEQLNGIVINEILVDPKSKSKPDTGKGFDTDLDGTVRESDEFVELYNTTTSAVDISGWTLGDDDGNKFKFPSGTEIAPEGKVTLVADYNGTLPPGFYTLNEPAFWNNGGDRVILSDGDTQISAGYNGQRADDNFGNDIDGLSLQRVPDGSDDIVSATPTPECFLTGTRILTESGYKLVEELKIGDQVQTAESELADVKWIGYQTCEPGAVANPLRGNPVLIKAGALGNNLPTQDLYISPDHSLFVDGLLINAGALVNDISIIKTEPTETFVYHSIELENHALLTVEGTLAESYLPHQESRENYDNGSEYDRLYPNGTNLMLWPMDYPRISSKAKVPNYICQKLMTIAEQLEGKALLCV
jgi:hypothetical protein